ncbi:acyltransferase ChoActase/COT/CPT [Calocera viscosa TUFC12733]|uniref:Carnitine O-acetyltransferase, mitochondrial n=1 Tax=Calocera viscosa (strain TUFC12733) TaxID=1330018 RepID=A0A167RXJ9_CALVF|nr:acyltransferase ChoActase/COT/CPT [Calocera viscosa TUFC12733]
MSTSTSRRAVHTTRPHRQAPPTEAQSDPTLPPMHRYQPFLPPLPVPKLEHTLPLYLSTIQPHCTPEQFSASQDLAQNFFFSPLGQELQRRLEARAAEEDAKGESVQASVQGQGGNWLADWWNAWAYNTVRDPVVPWVSYYYVHKDPEVPKRPERRAAELVRGAMAFRELVESGRLEPDKMRQTPLDMSSFKYLFNACRYPHATEDYTTTFPAGENGHVVFVRNNRFWKMDVQGLGVGELERDIAKIYAAAGTEKATPVGSLTSAPRDFWATGREALLSSSGINEAALQAIDSAVIVVALDEGRPVTREEIGWACWAGDGRGRWYDKHQFIVFDNGRSGFLGEHSAMDGTPTLRMNEFVLAALAAGKFPDAAPTDGEGNAPEELVFELDDNVRGMIKESERMFDEVMAKHDMHVLQYSGYGSDLIKQHKTSPDAWAQLVMQLAWHMAFGRPGVCYESCQTRKFRRGRTEVIRSASSESKAFAEAMLDPTVSDLRRKYLFGKAAKRHLEYATLAANGMGVDRHLLGLRFLLKDGEGHPFLEDEPMARTKHWEMSTSQLSSPWMTGWGYAEVVPDGYGLAYAIGADHLRWTVTSQVGGAARMAWWIEEAAGRVRGMMERARREEELREKEKVEEKAKL